MAEQLGNAVSATATRKALGLDGLAPDSLHHLGQVAKKELILLINLSGWPPPQFLEKWPHHCHPQSWETPSNPSPTAPITLLNLIPKIMEHLIYAQVIHFAETTIFSALLRLAFVMVTSQPTTSYTPRKQLKPVFSNVKTPWPSSLTYSRPSIHLA